MLSILQKHYIKKKNGAICLTKKYRVSTTEILVPCSYTR